MTTNLDLSFAIINSYIKEGCNQKNKEVIEKFKKSDTKFFYLFHLIDQCKQKSSSMKSAAVNKNKLTFHQIEDLLVRIFSGSFSENDARIFLDQLEHDTVFYTRLLSKLPQSNEILNDENVLSDIFVKSDRELISLVKSNWKKNKEIPILTDIKLIPLNFLNLVARFLSDFHLSKLVPQAGIAISLIFVGIITSSIFFDNSSGNNLEFYFNNDRVPYEYKGINLRGTSGDTENKIYDEFRTEFMNGMSDYIVRDYQNAITKWEQIQSIVDLLEKQNLDTIIGPIRDYYFYKGISYLSMSQKGNMILQDKVTYTTKSIILLTHALALATANNIDEKDRDTFFLGVAYGTNGQLIEALSVLNTIKQRSEFKKDASILIERYSGLLAAN